MLQHWCVPDIGPARRYDIAALNKAIEMAKENKDQVRSSMSWPSIVLFISKLKENQGDRWTLMVNPDGHEWLRAKWSLPVRKY